MKLKRLEIQGFKSFAEKIKLEFNHPVTGVVGPNGSGKSNIADAIRWVLGEQSVKSLRGSRMEDVIFAGTASKPPLNFAQVSITFDNFDNQIPIAYKEVTITRKVFRNGESEYQINRNACRLKDIRELFMDTGVGKEGYSIISQGRIEEILNSKGEDRRQIFEEASGISKYKYKKEESIKKLEKTRENLNRLHDLLEQQEERVVFLKKEAKKAEVGMALLNEIETSEFSIFSAEAAQLDQERSSLEQTTQDLEQNLGKRTTEINILEERLLPNRKKLEEFDESIDRHEQIRDQLSNDISGFEIDIKLKQEANRYREQDSHRLVDEIAKLEKNLLAYQEKQKILAKQITDHETAFHSANHKELECQQKLAEVKGDLTTNNNQLTAAISKREQLSLWIEELRIKKETQNNLDTSKLQEMKDKKAQLRDLQEVLQEKALERESVLSHRNTCCDKKYNIQKKLESLMQDKQTTSDKAVKYKQELMKLESGQQELALKLELLENLIENYEGYHKPVQDLFRQAQKNRTIKKLIIGTLADHIEVEPRYQKSIDTVLGNNLQNVITRTDHDAKDLIHFLKEKKISRITFLPLNKIHPRPFTVVEDPEILAYANQVIQCDPSIRNLVDYFLNKTVIVKDLHVAVKISQKLKNAFRLVTLEGDVVNTWGSLVGGYRQIKGTSNLINRRQQLAEFHQQRAVGSERLKEVNHLLKAEEESLAKTEQAINVQKELIFQLDSRLAVADQDLQKLEIQQKVFESQADALLKIINQQTEEHHFTREDDQDLKKWIRELSVLIEQIKEMDNHLKSVREESQKYTILLNQAINESEFHRRNKLIVENQLMDLESDIDQVRDHYSHNLRQANKMKDEFEKENQTVAKLEKKADESKKLYQDICQIIQKSKMDRSLLKQSIQSDETAYGAKQRDLSQMERAYQTACFRKESLDEKAESNLVYLMDEYSLSREEIFEKFRNSQSGQFIITSEINRKKLRQLKEELRDLGHFSTDAISEYNQVSQHLNFLRKQEQDLLLSKSDIQTVISKLEKKMTMMFSESLLAINQRFNEIFHVLFDGGRAELVIDTKDVLNSGIEIIAEPPGKKLQNLSLLSGGERSLTAVAILFAIFETRPSPFCILDEIDASLDEANIHRYTSYLRSFQHSIQFIMITHRKSTMEMADLLYGISMEEEGISKVISLQLEN